jgi:hypothetical protein
LQDRYDCLMELTSLSRGIYNGKKLSTMGISVVVLHGSLIRSKFEFNSQIPD